MNKKIKSALISVFHKDGLENIVKKLDSSGIKIFSTGGTHKFITDMGIEAVAVEDLTGYPSILGGRVKTLHPLIFGGILSRRSNNSDVEEMQEFEIPPIDLVIVDLYPFEETLKQGGSHAEIIEKIDIGGISLIRAAAKNFEDVLIVSNRNQYNELYSLLEEHDCTTNLKTRKKFAKDAFSVSSNYDAAIFTWFDNGEYSEFRKSCGPQLKLRYGENPHQQAYFYGDLSDAFEQIHGKEISYNNLLDIDAGLQLISDFGNEASVAIIKHNNACGMASRSKLSDAWNAALAGDPVSAFGGIIACNTIVDVETAQEINKIFFEIIIAPNYTHDALEVLKQKKNRIILIQKQKKQKTHQFRSMFTGVLLQERDAHIEKQKDLKIVSNTEPTESEISDMLFANKLVKHTKSNAIVLVKDRQLLASGTGQTSRVDALKQAIDKARHFGFDLNGAVMASDAFFPFKDSVEIAFNAGITAVIQPGGSIRDQETIDFCNENNIAMVFTRIRHFKH
ncbi:MAG: bifunctional phosphoribosylaminoimidazolecarboxamide formyltransferase/IMP cyclohydrolase [Bacteroidales bacterium]|nr:bifunctional phosphoribosylaminoimidazolecarboxamide formyltransferase/IMP cyclohydrolase [Bacteroidales bacterium]